MKKFIILLIVLIVFISALVVFSAAPSEAPSEELTEELAEPSDNPFGFLMGGSAMELQMTGSQIKEMGAQWIRPHPGEFVWGYMQDGPDASIDFSRTDEIAKGVAETGFSLLVTLWPYAEWDQENRPDAADCQTDGEFTEEFGIYRCAPHDWDAYEEWVRAVVERYDGDGQDDMPGLAVKIKHWEVWNEPDIKPEGDSNLTFFIGEPEEYAGLLKRTSNAIRSADPEAQILIAGAAGGKENFLDFYRGVFADPETHEAFDIANVHCLSSGYYDSLNVEPYLALLTEFGLEDKPIWVTEAETFISDDPDINAAQLKESTKKAFELGAERIFYTSSDFHLESGLDEAIEIYQWIFDDQKKN